MSYLRRAADQEPVRGPIHTPWAIAIPLVVLLVGGVSATLAGSTVDRSERRAANVVLARQAAIVQLGVTNQVNRYTDIAEATAAGAGAQTTLTAADFADLTALVPSRGLAGATSITFVTATTDAGVPALQRHWRAAGATGLTLVPVGEDREHLFTVVGRGISADNLILGRDVAATPEVGAALHEARFVDGPVVSDPFVTIRDRTSLLVPKPLSFVIAAPSYAPTRTDGRRGAFRGWTMLALRGTDFLARAMQSASQGLVNTELQTTDRNHQPVTVAEVTSGTDARRHRLHETLDVDVLQQTWTLQVRSTRVSEELRGGYQQLGMRIGIGGGCITVLLAALTFALLTWRARTAAQVVRATARLTVAAAEARRQAGLFEAVMDSVREGVVVVDQDGALIHGNPTALALVGPGGRAGHLAPDRWQDEFGLHHTDGTPLPVAEEPIARALTGELVESAEVLLRNDLHPAGVRLEISAVPLDPGTGQSGVVSVLRDVTALRAHEAELLAFAGIVAHDLKSPLTSVNGYLELLEEELSETEPDDEIISDSVKRIKSGTDRMGSLIDDLLAYATARDAPLDLADFDLRPLVDEVVSGRIDHLTAAPVRLGGVPRPDVYIGALPAVRADRSLLRQLLDNLIGNALKYTPPGQPARIDITARYDRADWVLVEIADRGIGVPAGQHEAVFTGFHRAHTTSGYAGTGLGLAICQRVVERHGGTITATDNPGGGARFCFTIPAGVLTAVEQDHAEMATRSS